ncbi:MAG: lipid biosynthesis acyltransferase [Firmicutes bacterium]|nr:lipid biosynthesis acyltransferase [Bacillota bacterium]
MQYYLVKSLSLVVSVMPYGVRRKLGDLIGELCWPFIPRRRKAMAIQNAMIGLKIDRLAAQEIVKKSAIRFGRMFMEVLHFPKLDKENIKSYVTIEGREHLDEALSYGRGALLAGAHSGNWEILGQAMALGGYPFVGVAQKQTNAAMDRFIVEYRELSGMHITYKTGVREMINLLGKGWPIGLMMDQDAGDKGVFVDFFGRPASTAAGAAVLARMKDAPIVPVFISENIDGTHRVTIHPPLWVAKTEERDEDIYIITQKITAIVEEHIRKYPHEWFWLHNRWKTPYPTN